MDATTTTMTLTRASDASVWLGVGIGATAAAGPSMAGYQFLVGTGTACELHSSVTSSGAPPLDPNSTAVVTGCSGSYANGVQTFRFTVENAALGIPSSGDACLAVNWAHGSSAAFGYHSGRGNSAECVQFASAAPPPPAPGGSGTVTLDTGFVLGWQQMDATSTTMTLTRASDASVWLGVGIGATAAAGPSMAGYQFLVGTGTACELHSSVTSSGAPPLDPNSTAVVTGCSGSYANGVQTFRFTVENAALGIPSSGDACLAVNWAHGSSAAFGYHSGRGNSAECVQFALTTAPTPPPTPVMFSCNATTGQCAADPHGSQAPGDCIATCTCTAPNNCGQLNGTAACGTVLAGCNVCDRCCQPWIDDQTSCDGCFAAPAPSGCGAGK